jgi:hypothetical protein
LITDPDNEISTIVPLEALQRLGQAEEVEETWTNIISQEERDMEKICLDLCAVQMGGDLCNCSSPSVVG